MNRKYKIVVAAAVLTAGAVYLYISHSGQPASKQVQGALGKRSADNPSAADVLTGGYDNARTNANLTEVALTPGNVKAGSFGKVFSLAVDGQIYAQPLYLHALAIPDRGTHNVVLVATMHNTVYAFDADVPSVPLWSVNLGPSVPTAKYSSDDGEYTDIQPENGILGTPVIDRAAGTLYAVAATYEDGKYLYRLHALDVTSGAEKPGSPVVMAGQVTGTGDDSKAGSLAFNPGQHLQRPALLLANGVVYAAFGSHGDADPFHGWIMGYSASNIQNQVSLFNATPNGGGGSFWQAGRGLAADESGTVYGVSSNGDTDLTANFADNVLRFDSTVTKVADWFSPSNVQDLNDADNDLGTTGALLIPGTNYLLTAGKQGVIYLLDRTNLGHTAAGDGQIPQRLDTGNFLIFNMALWNRPDGPLLYTHTANAPMTAYRLKDKKFSATPVAQSPTGFNVPFQGMTISANGTQSGTGVLWVLGPAGSPRSPGVLHAYNAESLAEIWTSAKAAEDAVGGFVKFVNPTVANGRVYVPTTSNQLVVYGLTGGDSVTSLPVITAVVNAASFAAGPLSPGEIVAIRGQNLGPKEMAVGSLDATGQLTAQLAGTQVTFNGVPAPLYAASDGLVSAIVPFEIADASQVTVLVTYNGQTSAGQSFPVAAASPGIFAADSSGSGPASVVNPDGTLNSPDQPAAAGAIVVVSATGGGQTNPAGRTGALASEEMPVAQQVLATVDGQPAKVLYAGSSAGQVSGAMQVRLRLPAGVSGAAPVVITVAGQASQGTVTVSVQ